jgi:hypothetical protein
MILAFGWVVARGLGCFLRQVCNFFFFHFFFHFFIFYVFKIAHYACVFKTARVLRKISGSEGISQTSGIKMISVSFCAVGVGLKSL